MTDSEKREKIHLKNELDRIVEMLANPRIRTNVKIVKRLFHRLEILLNRYKAIK